MKSIKVTDDMGTTFELRTPPKRVVSLVPSDTYSIVMLGARDRLVGRTRYCVEPSKDVEGIAEIGGTKDADVEAIADLKPDMIVANQEENSKKQIEKLVAMGARVFVSFPQRVAAGVAHLARLAVLLGFERGEEPARSVVAAAYHALREAEAAKDEREPLRAFVPIWMDPLMTANGSTFLSDALALAGGANVFADRDRMYPLAADHGKAVPLSIERLGGRDTRYPRVTLDEVVLRQPEVVLLPDEPHPFSEEDAGVFRALDVPAAKRRAIHRFEGKDLLWYGARSTEGIAKVRALVDRARISSHAEN